MKRLTLNILLSLIIQSKITGRGMVGNGRLYVKMMKIIADNDSTDLSAGKNILNKFNNEIVEKEAYHKLERFISRFLKTGKGYPYEIINFADFESCIGNPDKYQHYLLEMKAVCDEIIDHSKADSLIYTLLEILNQDNSVNEILYGSEYISKDKLFGSYARPKKICIEALLTGLLYYTHKNPTESAGIELLNTPEKLKFHIIRFSNNNSLDLEMPVKLIENICENSRRQKPAEMKYRLEIRHSNRILGEFPDSGNVFLYGTGGAGKSTLLINQICNKNTINFYFPLYNYSREIHRNLHSRSCWVLLNILLKYHYQYEYSTYETCCACEGEDTILNQLTELNQHLKNNPVDWKPSYVLLLDGLNEMPSELQADFADELLRITGEWKNVRIIITGRTTADYAVFETFRKIEVCGIADSERDNLLSGDISGKLLEILKIPMFLNMYLENKNRTLNTCGEILDSHIMNWKAKSTEKSAIGFKNSLIRFIVQYILPFSAKIMADRYNFVELIAKGRTCFEIDRGDLYKAIDSAFETYILDEFIYQSYLAPQGFKKKSLLESREKFDFIELILDNIGLMEISENNPYRLHFTHQYFRDYFIAKHTLNLLSVMDISYRNSGIDEQTAFFRKFNLDRNWFNDDYEIYKLMGEICGDYKNIPDKNNDMWLYNRTILDKLLDMYRRFNSRTDDMCIAENVLKTMSIARNGIICDVDFSRIAMPFNIPCNIKFSLNGEYPCRFRSCRINQLEILSDLCHNYNSDSYSWGRYAVYSPDKKLLLIIFDNNYALLWDVGNKKIIRDYSLSQYAKADIFYNYAEFSPNGQQINFFADGFSVRTHILKTSTCTGEILEDYLMKSPAENSHINRDFIDEQLKCEILAQLPHFRNCDFRYAESCDKDCQNYNVKYLPVMGAVLK
ncbi:MAG: hypothetical protein NC548_37855 [Lachnospiraceae bacterium]|nr:hypothetical protein [Lachnospiraceae bacterium]MCM1231176.1 hypothetical protein [Ruminococcus flavefaciens]